MTRAQELRWEASGLTSEARRHRAMVRSMKRARAALRGDPLGRLRLLSALNSREMVARDLERRAKELRSEAALLTARKAAENGA